MKPSILSFTFFFLKKPSDLQPDQTGEPFEDVHIQTADAVVGQISVGNRKDAVRKYRRQTRRSLNQVQPGPEGARDPLNRTQVMEPISLTRVLIGHADANVSWV